MNASLTRSPRRVVTDTWLLDEQGEPLFRRVEGPVRQPAAENAAMLRRGAYIERVITSPIDDGHSCFTHT